MHVDDRVADFIALPRTGMKAVEFKDGINPLHRPGAVISCFQKLQGAKGKPVIIARHCEMTATAGFGERLDIFGNDLRAFDVLGYTLVPEPSSGLLFGAGLLLMVRRACTSRPQQS